MSYGSIFYRIGDADACHAMVTSGDKCSCMVQLVAWLHFTCMQFSILGMIGTHIFELSHDLYSLLSIRKLIVGT